MIERAHAWRSGLIEFRAADAPLPEGAIGLPHLSREDIEAEARHAYDGTSLLVPGVPEAETGDEAVDALLRFTHRLEAKRN